MNSSQRRKNQRNFPFVVSIGATSYERYIYHDKKMEDAQAWCKKKFKKDSWHSIRHWDHSEFKFTKDKDAVFFSLRWL